MAAQRKSSPMDHPVVITFLIFAIIAFMYLAAEVLKPLALAILLSFALVPISQAARAAKAAPGPRGGAHRPDRDGRPGGDRLRGRPAVEQPGQRTAEVSRRTSIDKIQRHEARPGQRDHQGQEVVGDVGKSLAAGPRDRDVQDGPGRHGAGLRRQVSKVVGPLRRGAGIGLHHPDPAALPDDQPREHERPADPRLRPRQDQPDDPDDRGGRPADQQIPGHVRDRQLDLRADRRAGALGDRRPLRAALGVPGRRRSGSSPTPGAATAFALPLLFSFATER